MNAVNAVKICIENRVIGVLFIRLKFQDHLHTMYPHRPSSPTNIVYERSAGDE